MDTARITARTPHCLAMAMAKRILGAGRRLLGHSLLHITLLQRPKADQQLSRIDLSHNLRILAQKYQPNPKPQGMEPPRAHLNVGSQRVF